MANNESSARAALSRRRALQIGAGAAFAAPMVTSLAATPAYAQAGSFCTGTTSYTFDDFSQPQIPADGAGLDTLLSNGSFPWDNRITVFPQSVSSGNLRIVGTGDEESFVSWNHETGQMWRGVFDDCPSKMVLYNCTSIPEHVQLSISSGIGLLLEPTGVVMNGNELHFDVFDVTTGNNVHLDMWDEVEFVDLEARSTVQPYTDLVSEGPFLILP